MPLVKTRKLAVCLGIAGLAGVGRMRSGVKGKI